MPGLGETAFLALADLPEITSTHPHQALKQWQWAPKKQVEEPDSALPEAEHNELSKPQTGAALEGADFVKFAPSEKPPN